MVQNNLQNTMSNIDYFNIVTGLVFGKLYKNFPVPMDINAASMTLTILFDSDVLKDKCLSYHYEGLDNEDQLVGSILDWLIEEDYIRCTDSQSGIIYCQCVLSSKGLQTLSVTLSPTDSNQSLGEQMVKAAEDGMFDGIKDLAKTVVCEGGKFIFQSAMESAMRAVMRP